MKRRNKRSKWLKKTWQWIMVLVVSGLVQFVFFYWQTKTEHEFKPLTAAEVLKRENFLNSKKEVYYEAIEIVNRVLAIEEWNGPALAQLNGRKRNSGTTYPSELENNMVYNKLCIYASSRDIPNKFRDFFDPQKPANAPMVCEFINLLKKDLGDDDWFMECEEEFIHIFTVDLDSSVSGEL